MLRPLTAWTRNLFARRPVPRKRPPSCDLTRFATEVLEIRTMLSVSLAPLIVNDLPNDKTEFIAANVTNTTPANQVSFNVSSSDPNVTATVLAGGRSLDLNVSGVDHTNTPFTGDIVIRLFENLAPNTTAHIIQLAQNGFYNGLIFHRVISGFVAQGGDPTGTGSGGSGPGGSVSPIPDEFSPTLTYTSNGLFGMANSGHDTNDSQFFITAVDEPLGKLPQNLNFENPIFGIVTSGFDILNKLMSTNTNSSDRPLTNEVINSATVFTDTNNGVIELQSKAGFTGSTKITITADDGHGNSAQQQATINIVADTANDPPFLGSVGNQTTTQGTPVTFTVQGVDLQKDALTLVVKDPTSFAANGGTASNPPNVNVSIQVAPASGSTPSFATITLTPTGTFTGTINMIVGVRDNFIHNSATSVNDPKNFDTQKITLTVNAGPVSPFPDISGSWVINGLVTTISQTGSTLTFTNESGVQAAGGFKSPTQIQAIGWLNMAGTLANNNAEIDWANGTVWTKGPSSFADISGSWLINGVVTTIQQTGAALTFTNERGQQASGGFSSATQIEAIGWLNMKGTLANNNAQINWANGTVWTKGPTSVPDISGSWLINGEVTTIAESSGALIFINERGLESFGGFSSASQIEAIGWLNMTGTLAKNNSEIDWSNGTVWTKGPTSVPNISGSWVINGLVTTIQQIGTTLTFTNERGQQSAGGFISATQIEAIGWHNLTGTLANNNAEINWSNGTVWTQGPTSVPDISGSWLINGLVTTVQETGSTLIFTNESGLQSLGGFVSANQVQVIGWGNLVGTLSNNNKTLTWANGTVWLLV